jgi:arylsulfatase A-like enzyme
MKKFCCLGIAIASIMLVLHLPHSAVAQKESKNILLIVADDMGIDAMRLYTDQMNLTPDQEKEVPPTPAIESLAANGVTFNNAYANPACSPTRGTLITGRYGFRTGITWVAGRNTDPSPNGELDVNDPALLPKLLQENGYASALIGKWHLTTDDSYDDPNTAGFDYWAGFMAGALIPPITAGYYDWPQVINGIPLPVNQTTFATTENVNQAIGFIEDQEGIGNPWFVSLNFAAPHSPYQVPPEHLVNDGTPEGTSVYDEVVAELGTYDPPGPLPFALTGQGNRSTAQSCRFK